MSTSTPPTTNFSLSKKMGFEKNLFGKEADGSTFWDRNIASRSSTPTPDNQTAPENTGANKAEEIMENVRTTAETAVDNAGREPITSTGQTMETVNQEQTLDSNPGAAVPLDQQQPGAPVASATPMASAQVNTAQSDDDIVFTDSVSNINITLSKAAIARAKDFGCVVNNNVMKINNENEKEDTDSIIKGLLNYVAQGRAESAIRYYPWMFNGGSTLVGFRKTDGDVKEIGGTGVPNPMTPVFYCSAKQFFFNIEDSIWKGAYWVNAVAIHDPLDATKCAKRGYNDKDFEGVHIFAWSGSSQAVTATGHGLAATGSAISNVGNAMVSSQQPTVPTAAPVGGKRKSKKAQKKQAKRKTHKGGKKNKSKKQKKCNGGKKSKRRQRK